MSLKNPIEIPKIPKARKKKFQNVIDSIIAEKKPDKIEYHCGVHFDFDSVTDERYLKILIETEKEFSSFAYELSYDLIVSNNTANILLLGLKAKINAVPKVQPAAAQIKLSNLTGSLFLNVYKQDGAVNSAVYKLNIYTKKIYLEKQFVPDKNNNRLFCKFFVNEEYNKFKN